MFPRSKSSNRTTRSRSNPSFIRKLNTNNEINQEPSSPKVTCIGQVRVKRSNKKKQTTNPVCAYNWLQKLKVLSDKYSCFRIKFSRDTEEVHESKRTETNAIADVLVPRNALLLTRSRSEPFRCGDEIWETKMEKLGHDETGEKVGTNENENESYCINGDEGFKVKPLNLNRCNSGPARTGDKFFMTFNL